MRWLWWRRPTLDEAELELLRRAKREAVQGLAEADARWPAVHEAAEAAQQRVAHNHIGELLERALQARPDHPHGGR